MAVMRSVDGRLFNVPDEEAPKYLIPAAKVAETLRAAGISAPMGAMPGQAAPGQVQAYGHHGHHGHHGGHHGHHGGGFGGLFIGGYPNYNNYQNYTNFFGF
jgi:hypothetical protein